MHCAVWSGCPCITPIWITWRLLLDGVDRSLVANDSVIMQARHVVIMPIDVACHACVCTAAIAISGPVAFARYLLHASSIFGGICGGNINMIKSNCEFLNDISTLSIKLSIIQSIKFRFFLNLNLNFHLCSNYSNVNGRTARDSGFNRALALIWGGDIRN